MITAADWYASVPWIDRPDADIDAYVRQLSSDEREWAEHYLKIWRRDGVVIFEKAVDDQTIDALLADIEHLIVHHGQYRVPVEVGGKQFSDISEVSADNMREPGTKINMLHQISAAATDISLNAPTMKFLRHVFADQPTVLQSLTFFRGSQQGVHVDYPYVNKQTKIAQLTASWVALEDVRLEAGALAYWPGGHLVERLGLFDWGDGNILLDDISKRQPIELCRYLQDRLDDLAVPKRVFSPRRGDVLVWHGSMPHEGTAIEDHTLTRKSYVTHYTARSAYPTRFMKPNAESEGHYVEKNGGLYFCYSWLDNPKQLPSGCDVAELQQQIVDLQSQVVECQQQIVDLQSQGAERQHQIFDLQKEGAERQQQIVDLQSQVIERQQQIVDLQSQGAERQQQIVDLRSQLAASRAHVSSKDQLINQIHASTSWRVTAPLRAVKTGLGRRRG